MSVQQKILRLFLVAVLSVGLGGGSAIAANIDWSGGGADNNWSNTANWTGGTLPGALDNARFGASGPASGSVVQDVAGGTTITQLNSSGTGPWNISGNPIIVNSTSRIFHNTTAASTTISNDILAPANDLTVETRGSQDITLTGDLSANGRFLANFVNASGSPKIILTGTNTFGNDRINLDTNNATTATLEGSVAAFNNRRIWMETVGAPGTVIFNQNVDGTYTSALGVNSGRDLNMSVIKRGAARLTLDQKNYFGGGLYIEEGELAYTGNVGRLGDNEVYLGATSGSADAKLVSLRMSAFGRDFYVLGGSTGKKWVVYENATVNGVWESLIVLSDDLWIDNRNSGRVLSFTGETSYTTTVALHTYAGTAPAQSIRLQSDNSFAGGLQAHQGLVIGQDFGTAFGAGDITIGEAGDAATSMAMVGGLCGLTFTNNIIVSSGDGGRHLGSYFGVSTAPAEFSGTISLGRNLDLFTLNANDDDALVLSGAISGAGGLTVLETGSDSVLLSGANTYTGPTIIEGQALKAGSTTAFGDNSAVVMGNNTTAQLDLNGNSVAIGSLTGGGNLAPDVNVGAATLTVGGDGTSPGAYEGTVSGSGNLVKTGAGTLEIDLTSSSTVAMAANVGSLVLSGEIDAAVTVASGAVLGVDTGVGTLTLHQAPTLGGELALDIDSDSGNAADLLSLEAGTLAFGGTLTVADLGADLGNGDVFNLFDAPAFSGSFGTTNLPALGANLAWDLSSLSVDGTISVKETIAPTVDSITLLDATPTANDAVNFRVTFSEAVVFGSGDISIDTDLTGGVTVTDVSTSDDIVYDVEVTPTDPNEDGLLGITVNTSVEDLAGNVLAASSSSAQYTINNTVASLDISAPSVSATNSGPASYTLTYTNVTSINLTPSSITLLNAGGDATADIAVSGTGLSTRTVTLSNISGDGPLGIRVAAATGTNGVTDTPQADSAASITVDNTAPTVLVGAPSDTTVRAGNSVQYAVTYTGADTINLTTGDVNVVTSGSVTTLVSVANGTTAAPTITVDVDGLGEILSVAVGAATSSDAVGNEDAGSTRTATVAVVGTPRSPNSVFFEDYELTSLGDVWYQPTDGEVQASLIDSGLNVWSRTMGDGVGTDDAVGTYEITNDNSAPNLALENTAFSTQNVALKTSASLDSTIVMEANRTVRMHIVHGFVTTNTEVLPENQNRYAVASADGGDFIQIWCSGGLPTGLISNVYVPRADGVINGATNSDGILDGGDCRAAEGVLDDVRIAFTPRTNGTTDVEMLVYREGSLYSSGTLVLPDDLIGAELSVVELNLKPSSTFVLDSIEIIEDPAPEIPASAEEAWMLY